MIVKLTTAPFTIDAEAIAEGLLEMFDDNERVALRFGLLPYEKIEIIRKALEAKFRDGFPNSGDADSLVAVCEPPVRGDRYVEFSMKKLVSEAEHLVCLALYAIGDLVV